MPLTPFQKEVMAVLSANRSEASHVAGGVVINATDDSARFSKDFDIFHDSVEELADASQRDVASLVTAGFEVEKLEREEEWKQLASFRKARASRGSDSVEIDWAHDSVFRFFPVVRDETLGWRLHLFDVAVNKSLALSARTQTRDYIDIVELTRRYSLEAILWAACGKDPGFNPISLFTMVMRFARVDPATLEEIKARHLDPIALKKEWIAASDQAREEMTALADEQPDAPIGVAFVDAKGEPGWIRRDPALRVHHPSLRGCWPVVH
jgi:hypothetical protein